MRDDPTSPEAAPHRQSPRPRPRRTSQSSLDWSGFSPEEFEPLLPFRREQHESSPRALQSPLSRSCLPSTSIPRPAQAAGATWDPSRWFRRPSPRSRPGNQKCSANPLVRTRGILRRAQPSLILLARSLLGLAPQAIRRMRMVYRKKASTTFRNDKQMLKLASGRASWQIPNSVRRFFVLPQHRPLRTKPPLRCPPASSIRIHAALPKAHNAVRNYGRCGKGETTVDEHPNYRIRPSVGKIRSFSGHLKNTAGWGVPPRPVVQSASRPRALVRSVCNE